MTPKSSKYKRSAATIVAATLATGMLALPVASSAKSCVNTQNPQGNDPIKAGFCVIDQALSTDPFTVVDEIRARSDRARQFGREVNDNNQKYYDEAQKRPGVADIAKPYVEAQVQDVKDTVENGPSGLEAELMAMKAAIEAEANATAAKALAEAEAAKQKVLAEAGAVKQKAISEAAAAVQKVNQETAEVQAKVDEELGETDDQVQAQVDNQTDPEGPGAKWRENTTNTTKKFVQDVSPVDLPSAPSGSPSR